MNNFRANYERIKNIGSFKENIDRSANTGIQRRMPMLSDLEVISLGLTAESSYSWSR